MAKEISDDLVCLEGSPRQVGQTFGGVNRSAIRRDVREFYRLLKEKERISKRKMLAAGKYYLELVSRYAPHWITEAEGIAAAADLDVEEFLAYKGAKYRVINRPECFTYYSAPRHNAGGRTLLHKNRDQVERPQAAYVVGTKPRGKRIYRFVANGDIHDIGPSMALNEKGLAIVADMGYKEKNPRFRGMMNGDILRIVVETCANVEEATALLRGFHEEKVYAGGKFGTHWMIADRTGAGVRIYQYIDSFVEKRSRRGFLVMREDARGRLVTKVLSQNRGKITAGVMNRLSRRRPVFSPSWNVSAYTALIPPKRPDLFSYAWFAVCNVRKTLYVPLYMGVTATPKILFDGTLYRLSSNQKFGADLFRKCKGLGVNLERFEQETEADRADTEVAAGVALRRRGENAARKVLTDGCLRFAKRAERLLKLLGGKG